MIREVLQNDITLILFSLRAALVSTIIALIIALPTAYFLEHKQFSGKLVIEVLTMIPLGIPPVVTGYILLVIFSPQYPIGQFIVAVFGNTIVFTWFAGALAAAVISFPLMVRAFQVGFSNVDDEIIKTARSLGLSSYTIFMSVTLPLAKNGVFAGILICFVRSLSEFGATIIVAGNMPGSTQNISTAIFTSIATMNTAFTVRLSVFSIVLAIFSISLHNVLLKKK